MKQLLLVLIVCSALLFTTPAGEAELSPPGPALQTRPTSFSYAPQVLLDGMELSLGQPPLLRDGCLLVPLSPFLAKLGVTAEWNSDRLTFLCWRGTTSVLLQMDIAKMARQTDGGDIVFSELEFAPTFLRGQAVAPMVPLAEAFGYETSWEKETRTMLVTTPPIL